MSTLTGGAQASPTQTNHGHSGHNHNNQPSTPDKRGQFVPSSMQKQAVGQPEGVRPLYRNERYRYEGHGDQKPELRGTVDMAKPTKVLVKFFFFEDTQLNLRPPGIEVTQQLDQKKLLGNDYKDQGTQPIIAADMSLSLVRRALANAGFYLAKVFMYDKTIAAGSGGHYNKRNWNRKRFAVTLEFHKKAGSENESIELASKMENHLRGLANTVWKQTYVWDNTKTAENSVTINCTEALEDATSTKVLTIRDMKLQVVEDETPEEKA